MTRPSTSPPPTSPPPAPRPSMGMASRTWRTLAGLALLLGAGWAGTAVTAGLLLQAFSCATCDPDVAAREGALAEVVATTGAHVVHPYDDPSVIAGAGTAALEALAQAAELGRPPAAVVTPVGGGGLLSGTVLAVRGEVGDQVAVHGAEPAGADDTARGLASGVRQPAVHPPATICDGLLTSLSPRTFAILGGRHDPHGTGPVPGVDGVTVVPDEDTVAAMRVLWERAKQVVEPSAAVAVAAARQLVASGRLDPAGPIVVVLSGGNVDLAALPFGGPLDPPG